MEGGLGPERPRGPGCGAFQSAVMVLPSPQGEAGNFRKVLSDTTCYGLLDLHFKKMTLGAM